jgi:hypothetical protein
LSQKQNLPKKCGEELHLSTTFLLKKFKMTVSASSSPSAFEIGVIYATTLQDKLSYNELTLEDSGSILIDSQKRKLRQKYGYCLECEGLPILLFKKKKNIFNPFMIRKEPQAVAGECAGGVCLVCHPDQDPSLSPTQRKSLRKRLSFLPPSPPLLQRKTASFSL